ncbi:flagellar hook assembly protein FlgD [Pseudomonas eucalypticola]|uniref:Basal-body rod modification protein FlgD n=1 Tax=Pseudomonas eucalypticola TaxID=2599595 RepID=A0A7D5H3E6_9PSED|nr:flagellar hook assembly protein FlgD [Pseudomonas eucalypticola]QKZ07327.1 flagellar hook assembly protein FlgD [Pseudomonas eucalypticola]
MTNTISSSVLSSMNTSTTTTSTSTATTADDLQSQFLTLLVTELQNQDPSEPMDNTEMVSQLAQINMISGITDLGDTLDSISGQIDTSQALQASALVGKGVLVDGDSITVSGGSATAYGVNLDGDADTVTATITDSSGNVVRTIDVGALDEGVHSLSWDGLADDGTTAPDGDYTVSISATEDGSAVTATALNYALVSGVSTDDSSAVVLELGANTDSASLSDIRLLL